MAAPYMLPDGMENYAKLNFIISDLCRDVLFEILTREISPADLQATVRARLHMLRMKSPQLKLILARPADVPPSSGDFDISTLYILIRNICHSISSPYLGWGNLPGPNDLSVAADVERIRMKRNNLMQLPTSALSDLKFHNEVTELEQIISRLDQHLGQNFLAHLRTIEVSGIGQGRQLGQMEENHINTTAVQLRQEESVLEQVQEKHVQESDDASVVNIGGAGSTNVFGGNVEVRVTNSDLHVQVLQRCHSRLVSDMLITERELDFMHMEGILDLHFVESIRATGPTRDKIHLLVEKLSRLDRTAYDKFLECLSMSEQSLLRQELEREEAEILKKEENTEGENKGKQPEEVTQQDIGQGTNIEQTATLLPPEILRMDSHSIALYKQALEEGKEFVHNIRIMIIGHSGVGKTTLARRLLGDPVELTDCDSTNGIEVHIDRCKVKIADQRWEAVEQDKKTILMYKRLATVLASRQKLQQREYNSMPGVKLGDKSLDALNIELDEAVTARTQPEPAEHEESDTDIKATANASNDHGDTALTDLKLKALIAELASKINVTDTDADFADVSVWDFAGQFVFYSTHQMFLSPRAVYLLVTDINKHIGDVVTGDECYFDSAGPKQCPISDFMDFWLNSIHSYTPSVHKDVPPVILVGTHADELTKTDAPDYRQKKSEAYFEAVRRHLCDNPMCSHLADEDYDIDNKGIDPKLEALKRKIFEVASTQPYWDEPVPTKWLPLERALSELKETGLKVIDHATVEELNEGLAVPISRADELELFLRFQHESGNLLYFSDSGFRDKVVLDSQWLVDALKSLITAKEFCMKQQPEIMKKWDEFFRKGILRKELLDAVWKKETNSSFHDNREHLLALMEKLNLIAKPRSSAQTDVACELEDNQRIGLAQISSEGDEEQAVKKRKLMKQEEEYYLAPCMLKDPPPEGLLHPCSQPGTNSTSVLCFSFNRKFLPAAVFHHLIATCLSEWSLWRQGRKDQIFCGCGVFKVDSTHQMTACLKQYVIEIWVTKFGHKDSLPCPETCMKVREFIDACLRHTAGCLPQSPNFEVCIKCPEATFDCLDSNIPVDDLRNEEEIACSRHHDYTHVCSSKQLMNYWYPIPVGETVESQERENSGYGGVHRSPAAQARSSELKRETADDTIDAEVLSKLDEIGKSVGAIVAGNCIGTVFRVGTKYVMTAWHVVRRILDPDGSGIPELRNLQRASINFGVDNTAIISHTVTCSIPFKDEHLDIAVLELVNPGCAPQPLPLHQTDIALTSFRRLCFFGYGHPSSHKKQFEQNVPVIPESSGKAQAAQDWLSVNKGRMEAALSSQGKTHDSLNWGYSGWDDPDKVIVNIFQEHGASGAPGLVYEEADRIKVMAVLTNGLPHCFWDLPAVVRATFPIDCRLEQGFKMSAIFRQMTHMAPHLATDIFSVGL